MSWRLAQPFILRSAGFPARLMDTLNMNAAARATDDTLVAEEAQARLADDLGERLRPHFVSRRESALRWKTAQKAFAKGRSLGAAELAACEDSPELHAHLLAWNAAVARSAAARAQAHEVFDAELHQARLALRAIAADTRFQEAVFLSSPHMYESGLQRLLHTAPPALRAAEDKRIERQLVMYAQRVCMKNETTSFFGPIGYGRFDAGPPAAEPEPEPDPAAWPVTWEQHTALGRRDTFMAYWAVDTLASALAALPCVRDRLTPRLDRSVARPDRLHLFIAAQDKTVAIPDAWADVLDRIGQGATVGELTRLGSAATLYALEGKGLVKTLFAIPTTVTQTLDYLAERLDALPEDPALVPWRAGVQRLQHLKAAFAEAALARRPALLEQASALFTALTGHDAARAGGKIYADRSLFYEECRSGHQQLRMSAPWSRTLEARLTRWLDVFACHALERRAFLQQLGATVFRQLFGDERLSVPFLHFASALLAAPQVAQWSASLGDFRSTVQQALVAELAAAADAAATSIVLPASTLDALCSSGRPQPDVPLLCSPDIMLTRQPDGEPLLVLGEVHDTLMVWGWALQFHEAGPALANEMREFVSGLQLDRVLNLLSSHRKKIIPFEYPGRTVEFRAVSGAGNPTLPIADLRVVREGDRLTLCTPGDPTPLLLHNGELPTLCHALFALPRCVPFDIDLGEHTPRIAAGGVVLQRERWRLTRPASGLAPAYPGTSYELFHDMRRLQRRLGMPERVFVKSPLEPKPVFIDFRCHLLLEAWDTIFPPEVVLTVSEMLPDSGQLWLTDVHGEAVTAELRTAFGRPPAHTPCPAVQAPLGKTEHPHA